MTTAKQLGNLPRFVCLVAIVATFLFFGCAPPAKHYLTENPDTKTIEYAKFEAAYFSYLATMTGAAAVALLGLMYLTSKEFTSSRRRALQVSVTSFILAVSVLTLGYASRNYWVVSQQPLKEWFTNLDLYVLGPFTFVAYLVGVASLIFFVVAPRDAVTRAC